MRKPSPSLSVIYRYSSSISRLLYEIACFKFFDLIWTKAGPCITKFKCLFLNNQFKFPCLPPDSYLSLYMKRFCSLRFCTHWPGALALLWLQETLTPSLIFDAERSRLEVVTRPLLLIIPLCFRPLLQLPSSAFSARLASRSSVPKSWSCRAVNRSQVDERPRRPPGHALNLFGEVRGREGEGEGEVKS